MSIRWTWVDWVYCLFVFPVLGFALACFVLYLSTSDDNFWILLGWPAVAIGFPILAGRLFRRWRRAQGPSARTPLWQWPLWSLPPLLLLAWFGAEAADPHRGSWLVRHLLLDSFAFEIEANLTFDGEAVAIGRRIDCIEWWDVDHISGAGISRRFPIYPTVQSVGQRLASGGAVMMLVPYEEDVCLELVDWADESPSARLGTIAHPLPDDYLPLIAWTPTPDDPEMIEAYVARSYYERPDARVHLSDLAIRFATPSSVASEEDEFDWFFPSPEVYSPQDYGRTSYFGLYAVPVDETEWSQDEPIAHLLRSIENPTIVDWGSLRRNLDQSSHVPRSFIFWSSMGDVVVGAFLRPQIYGGHPETGSHVGYVDDFIPLRREGEVYVPAPDARGLVVLYRQPAWARMNGESLRVRLKGSPIAIQKPYGSRGPALRYAHLFDPRDDRVYALGAVYIHSLQQRAD